MCVRSQVSALQVVILFEGTLSIQILLVSLLVLVDGEASLEHYHGQDGCHTTNGGQPTKTRLGQKGQLVEQTIGAAISASGRTSAGLEQVARVAWSAWSRSACRRKHRGRDRRTVEFSAQVIRRRQVIITLTVQTFFWRLWRQVAGCWLVVELGQDWIVGR